MDTFLSQVMMFVCVTVPLSYAKDSVCTGKTSPEIQLRGPDREVWYCDGEVRRVEILCGGQLGTISTSGTDDTAISSAICRQLGCDGGTGASPTMNKNEKYGPVWIVNCDNWEESSLKGCTFTRTLPNETHYIINVKCTELDNANMLFIVDIFEFSLFLVTIIFGALLLYRAVMWKFNADSKEDDQFKSRPMVMVQGTLDDANQPLGPIPISQPVDTSPQEAPIMEKTKFTLKNETAEEEGIGETPELVYNPCYGPVSEKDKHETLEQKHPGQTKLGETPELADNICYEALSENAGHSSYHDLEAEDDTGHDEAPELVYNICYGTVTSKGGQATPVDQEDIEQGETPEFVENVCYEAFSEA